MSTLVQLESALAVGRERSFSGAARRRFITQPALSVQIQRLEEELGLKLFDRSARPVAVTEAGRSLLAQFQRVVDAHRRVAELSGELRGVLTGPFRLGIIPTIAPFLLPRLLAPFTQRCPQVRLVVRELTTAEILAALKRDELDGGILATPIEDPALHERRLFDEPFHLYRAPSVEIPTTASGAVIARDLPLERLLVMTEGHCLRTQVLDVCALGRRAEEAPNAFDIQTGSVATLLRVVDAGGLFTVLPSLAVADLPAEARGGRVLDFEAPAPYREVGLIARRVGLREAVREALAEVVRSVVPESLTRQRLGTPVPPLA